MLLTPFLLTDPCFLGFWLLRRYTVLLSPIYIPSVSHLLEHSYSAWLLCSVGQFDKLYYRFLSVCVSVLGPLFFFLLTFFLYKMGLLITLLTFSSQDVDNECHGVSFFSSHLTHFFFSLHFFLIPIELSSSRQTYELTPHINFRYTFWLFYLLMIFWLPQLPFFSYSIICEKNACYFSYRAPFSLHRTSSCSWCCLLVYTYPTFASSKQKVLMPFILILYVPSLRWGVLQYVCVYVFTQLSNPNQDYFMDYYGRSQH